MWLWSSELTGAWATSSPGTQEDTLDKGGRRLAEPQLLTVLSCQPTQCARRRHCTVSPSYWRWSRGSPTPILMWENIIFPLRERFLDSWSAWGKTKQFLILSESQCGPSLLQIALSLLVTGLVSQWLGGNLGGFSMNGAIKQSVICCDFHHHISLPANLKQISVEPSHWTLPCDSWKSTFCTVCWVLELRLLWLSKAVYSPGFFFSVCWPPDTLGLHPHRDGKQHPHWMEIVQGVLGDAEPLQPQEAGRARKHPLNLWPTNIPDLLQNNKSTQIHLSIHASSN